MRLDKFANPIFNQTDLFDALYLGHQIDFSKIIVTEDRELTQFSQLAEVNFAKIDSSIYDQSIDDFDKTTQSKWFMPEEYYNFDIREFCISRCTNITERTRIIEELEAFTNRNMIQVLQWLKFFVDTCLKENIVWGVGRGSSVSSYVLYLIGVHKIDSIKYNLDWHDFLR